MIRNDLMKRIESRRLCAWQTLDACTRLNPLDVAMSNQECEETIRAAARAKAVLVPTDPEELAALVAELETLREVPCYGSDRST